MRHFTFFLLFFAAIALYARPQNGFDIGCGVGYRKDRMAFSLKEAGGAIVAKEGDRDLRAIQMDFYFEPILWGTIISSRLDWGWYLSGKAHDTTILQAPSLTAFQGTFSQNISGVFVDAEECLGYIFDFRDRQSGFRIIPEVGCSIYYQNLYRGQSRPNPLLFSDAAMSFDLSSKHLLKQWWGPMAGGQISLQMMRFWIFEAEYFYYFLNFKQTFESSGHLTYFAPISSEFMIRTIDRAHFGGSHGQSFRAKIAGQVGDNWRLNWRGSINNFRSKKKATSYHQDFRQLLPSSASQGYHKSGILRSFYHSFATMLEAEYFF